ncbi:MAG: Uncharacterised protein [Cellulomonadaceae bacterium TMED98]|nr:MAG: Uncharacterised protein [Cellulomonadaceae bacterium TMED98]
MPLRTSERHVRQSSMSFDEWNRHETIWVPPGSAKHEQAGREFNPNGEVSVGLLIPADCAWAIAPYPDPVPPELIPRPSALYRLSVLTGHLRWEIEAVGCAPSSATGSG